MKRQLSISIFSILLCCQAYTQIQLFDNTLSDFETSFSIETSNENKKHLLVYLELNNESYVISPFSKDTIYGHLELALNENEYLTLANKLSESPLAKEEFDPILETQVRFVKTNTRYQQELDIKTEDDFQTEGHFWFLLEPACIPYKITFRLSQKDGILEVEKLATSKDY